MINATIVHTIYYSTYAMTQTVNVRSPICYRAQQLKLESGAASHGKLQVKKLSWCNCRNCAVANFFLIEEISSPDEETESYLTVKHSDKLNIAKVILKNNRIPFDIFVKSSFGPYYRAVVLSVLSKFRYVSRVFLSLDSWRQNTSLWDPNGNGGFTFHGAQRTRTCWALIRCSLILTLMKTFFTNHCSLNGTMYIN
jgi:hypothetical protein